VVFAGLLALAAAAPAQADRLTASQSWNGIGFGYCVDDQQSIASTFTPAVSGRLKTVSVWLQSAGSDRSVSAEIRAANPDGSPTSTVLGSTQITAPGDPAGAVHEDSGTFPAGPVVTAGTSYVLALTSTGMGCLPGWSFSDSGGAAWFARPSDFDGWQQIQSLPVLDHQAFALSVAIDSPPDRPAAPKVNETLNADGNQTLSWSATTDPDGDAVDHYVLQHERADQSSFSDVATVSGTSYQFGADGPSEGEGSWTYRVVAVDSNSAASAPSDASAPVVVDHTKPSAPSAQASPAAAYTDGSGTSWYKDSVSVSFSDHGDPPLIDGSPGSGVASVTSSQTFDSANVDGSTGRFSIDGTATDRAGNVSDATTVAGKVDWQPPEASFSDCPQTPVLLHSARSVEWTASDPAPSSGLATASAGSLDLDTAAVGAHTASSPAPSDNVGHTGHVASCTYTVGYSFSGFGSPVHNAPVINAGKGGRTYPVKWQLGDANGQPIATLGAVSSITYKPSSCASFTTDPTGSAAASTPGASGLRYDAAAAPYQLNWATPGAGCYTLFLTLDSGQVFRAYFSLS
jgi:hypothetical protein